MKVWFKRIVIGAVTLFIVALLGLAIFLLTFDPNAYKNKVQELVAERYQRTLLINGDISLSLFPRIGLTVKDVSLSDRDSASVFASIEQARVAVAIWPLLSDNLVVDHISVTGFRAWVSRSKEGLLNFQDLLERPVENVIAAGSGAAAARAVTTPASTVIEPDNNFLTPGAAQMNIDIAGLELKDGQIHFVDDQKGYAGRIADVQLNTGRMTFDQPFDVTLKGVLQAESPIADARFQGQALLRLDRAQNRYAAQKLNVQISGTLADLKAQSITLQGNVAYSAVDRLFDARALSLGVQGSLGGQTPVNDLSVTLAAPQLKVDPSRAQLEVQKLALRVTGKTPAESFDVAFDAPELFVSPEQARGDSVSGTVKMTGDSVLGLAVEMAGLGGNVRQLTLKEIKVDGTYKQTDRLTRINMVSPVRWNADTTELGLTAIKGDVKIDAETLGPAGFEFPLIGSVLVNLEKQSVGSDLNAVLNGNPLSFSTRVSGFEKPAIRLNLRADELDLDKLFPVTTTPEAPSADKKNDESVDDSGNDPAAVAQAPAGGTSNALDLTVLDSINLVATARVGRVAGRGLEATDLVVDAKAGKGRLDISQLSAKLYQGALTGKATATSKNALGLQLNLAGVSVGPLVAATTGHDRLTGTGVLRLNLKTQAQTTEGLLPALGGTVQIALRDGSVKGFNLLQTLVEISEALSKVTSGKVPDISAKYDLSRETQFTSLDANLNFASGAGTITRLAIEAPLLRVSQGAPATIDLARKSLDVVANVRVVNTTRGQGGPDLSRLRGITIPVRVQGPFNDMSYGVDVKSMAGGAARQVLEQGLKDIIQQKIAPSGASRDEPAADPVKDLGNTLKGLLGR
ncbi:MAG: AsmA family protein [Pusillimonas sp.]